MYFCETKRWLSQKIKSWLRSSVLFKISRWQWQNCDLSSPGEFFKNVQASFPFIFVLFKQNYRIKSVYLLQRDSNFGSSDGRQGRWPQQRPVSLQWTSISASFSVYFCSFQTVLLFKICWQHRDSNSDRQQWRRARWPLHHCPSTAAFCGCRSCKHY